MPVTLSLSKGIQAYSRLSILLPLLKLPYAERKTQFKYF